MEHQKQKGKTHGGKREGSGRPKKKPTTVITLRVPLQHAKAIKKQFTKIVEQFTQNKKEKKATKKPEIDITRKTD